MIMIDGCTSKIALLKAVSNSVFDMFTFCTLQPLFWCGTLQSLLQSSLESLLERKIGINVRRRQLIGDYLVSIFLIRKNYMIVVPYDLTFGVVLRSHN